MKGVIDEGFPTAVWVRAEISELRDKNGHLYLTLTERNERGDILAQVKGIIWRNRAQSITTKFEEATGEGLKTDIKILCLAGCDRAGARDYAAFLGFLFLEPS